MFRINLYKNLYNIRISGERPLHNTVASDALLVLTKDNKAVIETHSASNPADIISRKHPPSQRPRITINLLVPLWFLLSSCRRSCRPRALSSSGSATCGSLLSLGSSLACFSSRLGCFSSRLGCFARSLACFGSRLGFGSILACFGSTLACSSILACFARSLACFRVTACLIWSSRVSLLEAPSIDASCGVWLIDSDNLNLRNGLMKVVHNGIVLSLGKSDWSRQNYWSSIDVRCMNIHVCISCGRDGGNDTAFLYVDILCASWYASLRQCCRKAEKCQSKKCGTRNSEDRHVGNTKGGAVIEEDDGLSISQLENLVANAVRNSYVDELNV